MRGPNKKPQQIKKYSEFDKTSKIQKKKKYQKTRRGPKKGAKNVNKFLRFFGVNAAGISKEQPTLRKALFDLNPSVFFKEQSKLPYRGKIKIDGYVLY